MAAIYRSDSAVLGGHRIQGNYIGVGADGLAELGNGSAGLFVQDSANNLIGGSGSETRNVISANRSSGIDIRGENSIGNVIQGNYVGTDSRGEVERGNRAIGIHLNFGAAFNTIGTDGDGIGDEFEGNVISGHTYLPQDSGIWLGIGHDNIVAGNFLGTNATGTRAIPNDVGIDVRGSGNRIGSNVDGVSDAVERNVISGNIAHGVLIYGSAATNNRVQGNYVGVDESGAKPLPNLYGVVLQFTHGNSIGGAALVPSLHAGNVISANVEDGIRLDFSDDNFIQGNYVGVDLTGQLALGNGSNGVYLGESHRNLIGGPLPGSGNVVSANPRRSFNRFQFEREPAGGATTSAWERTAKRTSAISTASSFPAVHLET